MRRRAGAAYFGEMSVPMQVRRGAIQFAEALWQLDPHPQVKYRSLVRLCRGAVRFAETRWRCSLKVCRSPVGVRLGEVQFAEARWRSASNKTPVPCKASSASSRIHGGALALQPKYSYLSHVGMDR